MTEPDYDLIRAVIRRDTARFIKLARSADLESAAETNLIVTVHNKLADLLDDEGMLIRAQAALSGNDPERVIFALTDLFYRGLITGQAASGGVSNAAN